MGRLRDSGLRIDDPLSPTPAPTGQPEQPIAARSANGSRPNGAPDRPPLLPARSVGSEPALAPLDQLSAASAGAGGAPGTDGYAPADRFAPPSAGGAWRSWSGLSRPATYRLPDELLEELADAAANLSLPVGLLVTAAIVSLLDQPAEVIGELVDRADDARIQGRRAARRGLTATDRGQGRS